MSDCIFCTIVDGDIPGRIVHETDQSLALLNASPLTPDYTLVVPKEHHARPDEVPADATVDLLAAMSDLVPRVEAAVDADVANVDINNDPVAGQEVDHVHVHIVPRFEGDGSSSIHAAVGERPDLPGEELADIEVAISG